MRRTELLLENRQRAIERLGKRPRRPATGRVQEEERKDGKRRIIHKPERRGSDLTDDPPVVGIDLLV
jgi:hypothetical protein